MSTYKLTFTVNIEEQDDPAARKHAKGIIEALGEVVSGAGVKLQQVYQDQPPRGVQMGRKKSYQRTRISGVRIFRGAPFKTKASALNRCWGLFAFCPRFNSSCKRYRYSSTINTVELYSTSVNSSLKPSQVASRSTSSILSSSSTLKPPL